MFEDRRTVSLALVFTLCGAASCTSSDREAPPHKGVPAPPTLPAGIEILAHRGVSQTFHREDLSNETCTAERIYPPTHGFLENTLPSMNEAFRLGATIVEIDIHRTADDRIVVFHDWRLECRTDGHGVTREQTLATLKGLDIGHGYTADGGKTFPFRGKGVGMMPTLEEVLERFPDKSFLLDQKDGDIATTRLLGRLLAKYPAEQRARLFLWGKAGLAEELARLAPGVGRLLMTRRESAGCIGEYIRNDVLPASCTTTGLGLPNALIPVSRGLIDAARAAGVPVYAAGVDRREDVEQLGEQAGPWLSGIITDKIEVISEFAPDRATSSSF